MRPGLLGATWALTALVATGVALGSVRLVGEQVAGRPPVLTPEAVAALAASAAPVPAPAAAAPPAPSAPDPVPVAPPEPAAPQGLAPAPGGAAAPVGSGSSAEPGPRPPVTGRGPSTALPAPRSQPVAPPPPAPPAAPAAPAGPPPADPPPASVVRTVTAAGGTLAVACEGTRPALVYATPTAGFTSEVRDSGDSLQVRFRGQEDESRVRVVCVGGSPSVEVEERD